MKLLWRKQGNQVTLLWRHKSVQGGAQGGWMGVENSVNFPFFKLRLAISWKRLFQDCLNHLKRRWTKSKTKYKFTKCSRSTSEYKSVVLSFISGVLCLLTIQKHNPQSMIIIIIVIFNGLLNMKINRHFHVIQQNKINIILYFYNIL